MAIAIDNTKNYVGSVSQTAHSDTITLSAGSSRKVVVFGCVEISTGTTLSATFDGNAMSERASASHSAGTELKLYLWTYDVADGAGSGSKTVTVTASGAGSAVSWFAWQLSGAATGSPEYASVTEASNSVSSISQSSVTVTEGAAIFAGGHNSSATPTYNTWSGVTERQENNESTYTTAFSDSTANTAGTKTVSVTMSATSGNKLLGVMSIAEAPPTGLSITSVTPSYSLANSKVIGTSLSAGQTLTYKGVACTSISASSSLTLTCVFPNFYTNNIKLGAVHEFKVVD